MDRNRQKYVKLSLAGKWVGLAREIILDNPGIEKSRFIEISAPLMPTHINKRGKKVGQVQLAIMALSHLTTTCKTVVLVDGRLTSKPRGFSVHHKGYTAEIARLAASNGTVSDKDLPHIKYFKSLARALCKRGVLRKVGPGVFEIAEATNDET